MGRGLEVSGWKTSFRTPPVVKIRDSEPGKKSDRVKTIFESIGLIFLSKSSKF